MQYDVNMYLKWKEKKQKGKKKELRPEYVKYNKI